MLRFLVVLLGMLTTHGPRQRERAWYRTEDPRAGTGPSLLTDPVHRAGGDTLPRQARPLPRWDADGDGGVDVAGPGAPPQWPVRRRRRISPRVKWAAAALVVGLIFRKAIAAVVMITLSGALHLVGINAHLPKITFAWPWQTISKGTTTNANLGPWVLQKIEGISRPALGQANFSFYFTRKVSKNIGIWPCWYSSTFYAAGHASATVNLNPGPAWWAPGTAHYQLRVLSHPQSGKPGRVAVMMVLPRPQLPQSVHDVTIDNIPSRPIDTQHSWTYPGFACGLVLRPQFSESVLYSQAQRMAFYKASHEPRVTGPLIASAESQAERTVRDNFIQPTVNAFGYTLDQFTIRWAAAS